MKRPGVELATCRSQVRRPNPVVLNLLARGPLPKPDPHPPVHGVMCLEKLHSTALITGTQITSFTNSNLYYSQHANMVLDAEKLIYFIV